LQFFTIAPLHVILDQFFVQLTRYGEIFDNFLTFFDNFLTTFLTFYILMVLASCGSKYYGTNFMYPGQTLAPVFVTALTKITFIFLFFGPSAAPPLRHLKNVKTGRSGGAADGSFSKNGVTFLSLRFAPVLPFSQLVAATVVPLQLISNMMSI
jgi:hypothetical protein